MGCTTSSRVETASIVIARASRSLDSEGKGKVGDDLHRHETPRTMQRKWTHETTWQTTSRGVCFVPKSQVNVLAAQRNSSTKSVGKPTDAGSSGSSSQGSSARFAFPRCHNDKVCLGEGLLPQTPYGWFASVHQPMGAGSRSTWTNHDSLLMLEEDQCVGNSIPIAVLLHFGLQQKRG